MTQDKKTIVSTDPNKPANDLQEPMDGAISASASIASVGLAVGAAIGAVGGVPGMLVGAAVGGSIGALTGAEASESINNSEEVANKENKHLSKSHLNAS